MQETNPVPFSWKHWLRHQSQIYHQSLETPVWPFLATLNSKKTVMKKIL